MIIGVYDKINLDVSGTSWNIVKLKDLCSGFEENIEVKQYPTRIRFARFVPSWMGSPKAKVIVEIRGLRTTIIECMGNPYSKKKAAAENAAEGAMWFLNQAGYRLKH
uniref:DRBM domain-containing protein n=1 Tax=Solanum lycopersicum TaxID=4081 RepID=A0A3Q7FUU6_SOLLC